MIISRQAAYIYNKCESLFKTFTDVNCPHPTSKQVISKQTNCGHQHFCVISLKISGALNCGLIWDLNSTP